MSSANKVIKAQPKQETKKRPNLTKDVVENINFFKEDLDALDEEVHVADELYGEIHGLYKTLTGGEYVPTRNLRDIAELAKNMVSARSYHSDAINKRISLKKLIVDVNFRANGGIDEGSDEAINQTARRIVDLIRQEAIDDKRNGTNQSEKPVTDKRTVAGRQRAKEEELLEQTLNERLESGEIVMGKNDKLVGTNDYVVSRYDADSEQFVAVDSRTGSVIENFPEERLPKAKVSHINSNSATLMSGEEIPLYNSLEFDDEYVDDED